MKLLILGGSGQVGFELQRSLTHLGSVIAPARIELDLSDAEEVGKYLNDLQPELIVNAAAWTSVDAAEEHQAACKRLNADLPKQLAQYAAANNIKLVHYSSDYVYLGTGVIPWQETSDTGPLNVYGQMKLEGDIAIQQSGAAYLIFRTSWVYSARGNNFMKTMLRLAKIKTELNVVADQVGAPTPARLIAQVTALALHAQIESGVYHLSPRGETSWHGFAQAIFHLAVRAGEELTMNQDNVYAIPTREYSTIATRPLNSRMVVTKLEHALNIQLPDWQSQLLLTLNEYLEK